MTQTQRDQLTQLVNQLIQAPSCCAEAKEAGQNWLTAAGTAGEQAATQALMAELEEDIMPIEGLIAFVSSPAGAQVFGAEQAKAMEAHAREIQAAGAKYCDCPACALDSGHEGRPAGLKCPRSSHKKLPGSHWLPGSFSLGEERALSTPPRPRTPAPRRR